MNTIPRYEHFSIYDVCIFDLDDVIFPRKEYVLQICYLFSAFVEYMETKPRAEELLLFLKEKYEFEGEESLFEKAQSRFNIPENYQKRYQNLFFTARLPLKLEMYAEIATLMQDIQNAGKSIWVVSSGNPDEEINKIRQLEWQGLQNHVRVFFTQEENKSKKEYISDLMRSHSFKRHQIAAIVANEKDALMAHELGIFNINVKNKYQNGV